MSIDAGAPWDLNNYDPILQVLFERHRYRQTPFEWVYDGLSPVLLADVLDSRKGLSIVLAIIYVLVGRDLGLALTMAPVPKAPPASSLAGEMASTFRDSCGGPCVKELGEDMQHMCWW